MSKAKKLQKKKEERRRTLLSVKALLPVVTVVLLLVAMAIPCFTYTVKGTGTLSPISEWTLLSNTWETSRAALFGTGDFTEQELGFSRACFLTVLISSILALVSVGLSVWSAVGAMRYLQKPEKEDKARALYRTFFNRPLLFFYQLLLLPLLAFPRIIVSFYANMMFYPTTLSLSFAEPLMIGAALLVLWVALTLGMKQWERELGLDPFADPRRSKEEEDVDDYESQFLSDLNEEDKKVYEMQEKSREEQLARIRQMFSRQEDEEDEENEENQGKNE